MSHAAQLHYVATVRSIFPGRFTKQRVIEIGSLDINGSVRQFFDDCDYTGVDLAPGRGVDLVSDGCELPREMDATFDVVCSCEMFEHNPNWAQTWRRMADLAKPGGLVFFSCATEGRAEHGTTRTTPSDSPLTVAHGWEHYRNLTERDFRAVLDVGQAFVDYRFAVDPGHHDLYFWGLKR